MDIELLKNTSNTNSFTRNFTKNKTVSGYLKEGSDILSPEIIIETTNPSEYNMMKIHEFGDRYYFIGWENINNDLWKAYTKEIDVLYTYKNSILGLNAIIDKQEYNDNGLLDDGSYITQVNTIIETKPYNGGFLDNAEYILITAGA